MDSNQRQSQSNSAAFSNSKELVIPPNYSNFETENNLSSSSSESKPRNSAMIINIPSEVDEATVTDVDEDKPVITERGIPGTSATPSTVKGLTIFTASVFIIGEMAGSGVLALPAAIVDSGWTGLALLLLACLVSGYCGSILGQSWSTLRERFPEYRGHVRYPYPAIGQKAVGNWGARAVTFCVNATLLGVCVVFLILASQNLNKLVTFHASGVPMKDNLRLWLLICASVLLPFTWLGTPKEFWGIAIGASVATALACLLICVCIGIDKGSELGQAPQKPVTFESFASAFGTIIFSFGGAATFPTIQTDMKKGSKFPISVFFAYVGVISMYLPVSVLGFLAYGKHITSNILLSIHHESTDPRAVILDIVLVLITAHLLFSFIIVLNPVSQQAEELLSIPKTFSCRRCVLRSCLMLLILGIAEAIPKFGPILSLIGGSTTTCLTFIFPCLFYLRINEGQVPLHIRVMMYEIIIVAVCGGLAATYSAIKSIIQVFT